MKIHKSFSDIGMSKIVEISEKAKVIAPEFEKKTGKPFIYFQRGEVGYPTAPFLADAFREAIEKGFTKYPKPGGEDIFKDAVASELYYRNDIRGLSQKNIIAVYGGQEGLELAFSLFRGKTCAGFTPCWSCMFDNILPYTEINFISVPLIQGTANEGWIIDFNTLEKALSRSEVFYFNSPHNPTGKVFSKEEVDKIVSLCSKYGVTLISDEAYKELIYRSKDGETNTMSGLLHQSPLLWMNKYENIISVNTFSKSFAATGFRIGYIASPREDLLEYFSRGNYTETAGVSTPTQYAFAKAINHKDREQWSRKFYEEMKSRSQCLVDNLDSRFNVIAPEGAFYCFINILGKYANKLAFMGSESLLIQTLLDKGIAVVPGSAFGKEFEGHIRLSFSTLNKELIEEGAKRLSEII